MAEIIDARVRQKKDTLANWEANPLIILDGEQAFVVGDSGQPINFKIGDGTKRFSDLPFWIQYDQAAFVPVTGNALPTPTQDVAYTILGEGTYTHISGNIVVPTGHWGVANWAAGSWAFNDMGEMTNVERRVSNNFLLTDSDFNDPSVSSIESFSLASDATIDNAKEYYIGYLYNTPTKFLMQIVDDADNPIAQYYNATQGLTGIQEILLTELAYPNAVFAKVVIDAGKVPTSEASLGNKLHINKYLKPETPQVEAPYGLNYNAISSQKMSKILSLPFYETLDYSSNFPFWGILDISVIEGQTNELYYADGTKKNLYLAFIRGKGGSTGSTIIQIKDELGNIVLSVFDDVNNSVGIMSYVATGTNIKVNITVDWSLITTSYTFTDEVKLSTDRFIKQTDNFIASKIGDYFKSTRDNTAFPFLGILDISIIDATELSLYRDGVPKDLYLTFIRGKRGSTTSTIIQIGEKVGGIVGVNENVFASVVDDVTPAYLIQTLTLVGTGVKVSVTVDWSVIKNDYSLTDEAPLNTYLFLDQQKNDASKYIKGSKLITSGDSITEGTTYPETVGAITGMQINKQGYGGCTIAKHPAPLYDAMNFTKIVDAVVSGDFTSLIQAGEDLFTGTGDDNRPQIARLANATFFGDANYWSVFYGTNDFSYGTPIGTNADMTDATFKGALNYVIKQLNENKPNVKLIFITPIFRSRQDSGDNKNSDDFPNTNGLYLKDYANAIKEICELHHVPYIDLQSASGINRYNGGYYLVDGLHPSYDGVGAKLLGHKIASGIKQNF